nr:hypothetical protein Itr_chr11CG22770 [Ipomoea trifida]GMD52901.1 hypothetical protein Iba_chr11bCG16040 [Ipomoea batatas]
MASINAAYIYPLQPQTSASGFDPYGNLDDAAAAMDGY